MEKLHLQIQSFQFSKKFVEENDTIRVSVTTLPDSQKAAISFESARLKSVHPKFTVKANDVIQKILIVFRKVSLFDKDPIIGSTTVNADQWPKSMNDLNNLELKTIDVFEPYQKSIKENSKSSEKRKVLGQIQIKFSIDDEMQFETYKYERRNSKNRNGFEYANMLSSFD